MQHQSVSRVDLSRLARAPRPDSSKTMAKTKGQARAARFLGLNCGTPPSTHERDSDFSDRFSECSDRSISERFRGVRDGIGDATSEVSKVPVVKLKFAQPLEDQAVEGTADEFDPIPPTRSAARSAAALEAMEAACDAAWPDTLLFAVSIGNLATSQVLPFAQRLDLPGPQQHELGARLGGGEPILPSRPRFAYGPSPARLRLCHDLEMWASAAGLDDWMQTQTPIRCFGC